MTPAELQKEINDLLSRLDADGWRPIEELGFPYCDDTERFLNNEKLPPLYTSALVQIRDSSGKRAVGKVDRVEDKIVPSPWLRGMPTHFKPLDDPLPKEAAALLRECLPTIKEMQRLYEIMQESKEYISAHGEKHNGL